MIGNMLNDLAKAIRRWTEKKCFSAVCFQVWLGDFRIVAFCVVVVFVVLVQSIC